MSCGSSHTAAVTIGGSVYCWGNNNENQCGLGLTIDFVHQPQVVRILDKIPSSDITVPVRIVQVACGQTHTVALSDNGELWTWGTGVQLGLGIVQSSPFPAKVDHLCGRRVLSVVCGFRHTAAVVASVNKTSPLLKKKIRVAKTNRSLMHRTSDVSKSAISLSRTNSASILVGGNTESKKPLQGATSLMSVNSFTSTNSVLQEIVIPVCLDPLNISLSEISPLNSSLLENESRFDIDSMEMKNSLTNLKNKSSSDVTMTEKLEISVSNDAAMLLAPISDGSISPSISKSCSSFLDETEAKEFLQKQLQGDRDLRSGGREAVKRDSQSEIILSSSATPASPFAKTVESLLQHVPSPPGVVQEYVAQLTRTVVSNIRTSVDRFVSTTGQLDALSGVSGVRGVMKMAQRRSVVSESESVETGDSDLLTLCSKNVRFGFS